MAYGRYVTTGSPSTSPYYEGTVIYTVADSNVVSLLHSRRVVKASCTLDVAMGGVYCTARFDIFS